MAAAVSQLLEEVLRKASRQDSRREGGPSLESWLCPLYLRPARGFTIQQAPPYIGFFFPPSLDLKENFYHKQFQTERKTDGVI